MQTLFRLAFWGLLAALAFVTLSPIGLRPEVGPADLERACAYAAFGVLAGLAYPRQRIAILAMVVVAAGMLELGQELSASRHARFADFLVKAGSGVAGWCLASLVLTRAWRTDVAQSSSAPM